jgi:hypothetical protein
MKKNKLLGSLLAVAILLLGSFFGQDMDIPEAAEPAYPSISLQENADIGDSPLEEPEALPEDTAQAPPEEITELPAPDGSFTTREDLALYIHTYGCLPPNFMTKNEARDLGWEGGGLDDYAYGMCIGGDRFGNYEGLLPDAPGRKWTECDIDTLHQNSRGAKRIVFSNDGLIYYTDDHYESFTLLYGEP